MFLEAQVSLGRDSHRTGKFSTFSSLRNMAIRLGPRRCVTPDCATRLSPRAEDRSPRVPSCPANTQQRRAAAEQGLDDLQARSTRILSGEQQRVPLDRVASSRS